MTYRLLGWDQRVLLDGLACIGYVGFIYRGLKSRIFLLPVIWRRRKHERKCATAEERTSQFLLPQHFGEELLVLVEERRHLAVLVIALGRHKHAVLRFRRQVLADLRNGEDDLLHGTITTNHLDLPGVLRVVVERRVHVEFAVHVRLRWTQLVRQLFVVTSQLQCRTRIYMKWRS